MMLVTTSIEETWGQDEPLLFLGDWCLLYHRRTIAAGRDFEVVRNHWDDREKLEHDEANLTLIHERLIGALTKVLNKIHGLDHKDSYWRMLVDPWLVSYTAVVWDRWECIRIALEEYKPNKTIYMANQSLSLVPRDYPTSVEMFLSDHWNHELFMSVLDYRGLQTCEVVELDRLSLVDHAKNVEVGSKLNSLKWRMANAIDRAFSSLSFRANKVALVGNIFSPLPQALLNIRMGQIPCFYWSTFDDSRSAYTEMQSDLRARAGKLLESHFSANDSFEKFLCHRLFKDAPSGFLESFTNIRNDVLKLKLEPSVIVTAYYHWSSDPFKIWAAEKVVKGSSFVVVEHGGSIHPRFDTMNFEDEIVTGRITWCAPYKENHTQLPPSKLVDRSGGTSGDWCTIVGFENPRYVYRATAAPHVSQCLVGFLLICQLVDRLDGDLRAAVRFKPYVDMGWSLGDRFADKFGKEAVLLEKSLPAVFRKSKIIICTYPNTTFSEGMLSGKPTLLFYPPHLWETLKVFDELLTTLIAAKILHQDPVGLALHLIDIWKDPTEWWDSDAVVEARRKFCKICVSENEGWLASWSAHLQMISNRK